MMFKLSQLLLVALAFTGLLSIAVAGPKSGWAEEGSSSLDIAVHKVPVYRLRAVVVCKPDFDLINSEINKYNGRLISVVSGYDNNCVVVNYVE